MAEARREGVLPLGIELRKNKTVVWEWEAEPGKRYPVYSATKSFTSTAIGLAAADGLIHPEDPLEQYFLDELKQVPDAAAAEWRKLTISRLLTMTVPGLPFRPSGNDWICYCFSQKIDTEKGGKFWYSNLPAYLAGVAAERAVRENLADYMERKLFEPLGISRPVMRFCPKGHFYGATGMELTAHELGQLGQLYLEQGSWNGKRILPQEWAREAVRCQTENMEYGYGYFFWIRPDKGFTIRGKLGQRCYVFPKENTVVSWVSVLSEEEQARRQDELFRKLAAPAIRGED